ncbi:hypothetical protein BIV57_03475 [Mangrovactinospora gilvigrisea]|uniref:Uncharacterized protein n=1 Tax=Mangrovactinospora gilvigrisea TaxID=1428644 RepID=A0A1J7BJF4_9ACTN|nr:hypothetical protein [Mangrovactinospora gilvigrisea]OIV38815.1 hypothetical protein BIV57_03475 [Mangrovactinospora gilvigrisea]
MYEPIRGKSVHTVPAPAAPRADAARRDQLAEQLAGHLGALLPHTGVLRRLTAELLARHDDADDALAAPLRAQLADLESAEPALTERIAQLAPSGHRTRFWQGTRVPAADADAPAEIRSLLSLHEQAHALAGRALVSAASRQDTRTAMLACRRMDAHSEALAALGSAP